MQRKSGSPGLAVAVRIRITVKIGQALGMARLAAGEVAESLIHPLCLFDQDKTEISLF